MFPYSANPTDNTFWTRLWTFLYQMFVSFQILVILSFWVGYKDFTMHANTAGCKKCEEKRVKKNNNNKTDLSEENPHKKRLYRPIGHTFLEMLVETRIIYA